MIRRTLCLIVFCFPFVASSMVGTSSGAQPVPFDIAEIEFAFPKPDAGYVTDIANLLTDAEEEEIEQWLWQVESRSNVEIAVVTIHSLADYDGLANRSIESFATALFDHYGVGNMPKNDGVLLLVSKGDRKARIELGKHYGRLRDADANQIMQGTIVPQFRNGRFGVGVTKGVKAIVKEFAGLRIGLNWPLISASLAIPVVGLIAFSLFRSGKRGWGWVCVGVIFILFLAVIQLLRTTIKHMPDSSDGSSGSWSSGGFGGGFGGGSSGGGGATGSW